MIGPLPHEDLATTWRSARDAPAVRHLDSAACSRTSRAVREAVAQHAALESEVGGYVAEAAAQPLLDAARSALAGLAGMPGDGENDSDAVAFTESAMASLTALLDSWPLPAGGRVVVGRGEYGEGVHHLRRRGLDVVAPEPDALVDTIRHDPPALVHLTHLSSYRGRTQPLAEVATACAEAGIPLWIDAAQSLGHLDCAVGAAAVYGTSRKWLAGPRGVGIVAVDPRWWGRLHPLLPSAVSPVRGLESSEAHVAGRVGLAAALREHLAAGPDRVRERLSAVGAATRTALDGVGGWSVADAPGDPSAIVALAPPAGVDVAETRARLLHEHAILTTVSPPVRSPLDPAARGALLRVSGHVDVTADDLDALVAALEGKPPRTGVADTA